MNETSDDTYLGIDAGTSGCRAVVIDALRRRVAGAEAPYAIPRGDPGGDDPEVWWQALQAALAALRTSGALAHVRRIAIAGTSGTLVLCEPDGSPVSPALYYDDTRARAEARALAAHAPTEAPVHGAASPLAKLLWWHNQGFLQPGRCVLHQADWLAGRLCGEFASSDYHNALKTGYDAEHLRWPAWIDALGFPAGTLPEVLTPGSTRGPLRADLARALGINAHADVVAGTTDGVAAFLGSGAAAPGDGATSLGTTLTLKLLATVPVTSPSHGVYSHRLGDAWLAGGASNSGGAAIARHFQPAEITALGPRLRPDTATGLAYYPLPAPGERFPINDPDLPPRFDPQPADRAQFLRGILEGIATIERQGYALLATLGAPAVRRVYTGGTGGTNPAWSAIRRRILRVPIIRSERDASALGAAILAADGLTEWTA